MDQEPDLSIPHNIGTPVGKILVRTVDPEEIKFRKSVSERKLRRREEKLSKEGSSLIEEVALCQVILCINDNNDDNNDHKKNNLSYLLYSPHYL